MRSGENKLKESFDVICPASRVLLISLKARSLQVHLWPITHTLLELTTSRSFLGDLPPDPLLEAICRKTEAVLCLLPFKSLQ